MEETDENLESVTYSYHHYNMFSFVHYVHCSYDSLLSGKKPSGKCDDKLLAAICDKQHYVIHYRKHYLAVYSSQSPYHIDSLYTAIRAISMATRLYKTKHKI